MTKCGFHDMYKVRTRGKSLGKSFFMKIGFLVPYKSCKDARNFPGIVLSDFFVLHHAKVCAFPILIFTYIQIFPYVVANWETPKNL